ncbi:hypothetical protein AVEN_65784-1 [Araneus ventricosus]|uniref:Nucleic-acid-binding protein from transposon X-element n=1 Tax=Araneus ventricosus TaxID=182803 RepID=A0A4Y2MBA8_ARAVE|nr:hypothetical protein AVEN_65784-1 [Araneus ventricosus]
MIRSSSIGGCTGFASAFFVHNKSSSQRQRAKNLSLSPSCEIKFPTSAYPSRDESTDRCEAPPPPLSHGLRRSLLSPETKERFRQDCYANSFVNSRKKNRVTICYKCSNFHHSARNCECKPRCIKCAGNHETRDCDIKNKIDNPTCINCEGEGHLASWRGCPKFPKTNNRPPIPTYAQKLKSNLNKTTNPINQNNPPVTEPITTNQDMRDFQTIAKALKTVKEALNEFPNLLEISKALIKTKDKVERLNLLLKLID